MTPLKLTRMAQWRREDRLKVRMAPKINSSPLSMDQAIGSRVTQCNPVPRRQQSRPPYNQQAPRSILPVTRSRGWALRAPWIKRKTVLVSKIIKSVPKIQIISSHLQPVQDHMPIMLRWERSLQISSISRLLAPPLPHLSRSRPTVAMLRTISSKDTSPPSSS